MPVITISRQYGSGGGEIANRICELLHYRYFDKSLILQAAADTGIAATEFVDYSEENHRSQGFIDRLFSPARSRADTDPRASLNEDEVLDEDHSLALVRGAIQAACQTGDMVILGRGGQAVLKDEANVLHVRIEAPLELRALRVQEQQNLDLAGALESIARHDSAAAAYLRRVYKIDWADPLLYHLVLNTGRLSLETATSLIVKAVETFQPAPQEIS